MISHNMWSSNHFSISSRFPCFSGSRFFRVQVFQGPGLGSGSRSRVRVQVLEVAEMFNTRKAYEAYIDFDIFSFKIYAFLNYTFLFKATRFRHQPWELLVSLRFSGLKVATWLLSYLTNVCEECDNSRFKINVYDHWF